MRGDFRPQRGESRHPGRTTTIVQSSGGEVAELSCKINERTLAERRFVRESNKSLRAEFRRRVAKFQLSCGRPSTLLLGANNQGQRSRFAFNPLPAEMFDNRLVGEIVETATPNRGRSGAVAFWKRVEESERCIAIVRSFVLCSN